MKQAKNSGADNCRNGRILRVIGDIMILFIVLFTIYLSIIMLHRINTVVLKDTYRKIFYNELILCGVLLLCSLDLRFGFFTMPGSVVLRALGWVMRIVMIVFSLLIVFFCGKVVSGSVINTAGEAENAIVLGMALENGVPQKDLIFRLDTAQRYLEEYPAATLILTGGNPDKSGLTEAGVMRELLMERGIPEERMILEDKATTTRENFTNSSQLLGTAKPIILISSNYHMDRAVRMAKEAGFENILRLPAPSDPLQYGANVMWEMILDMNDIVSSR